jgi:hypothetical protein
VPDAGTDADGECVFQVFGDGGEIVVTYTNEKELESYIRKIIDKKGDIN